MKKKLLAIALCVCTVFSVTACADKEKKQETKYELGQYKGIEVDSSLKTVDKKLVDEYLASELDYHSKDEEVKEAVLAKEDRVKISYKSTVDGKEYKNSEGFIITLNDKGFSIPGVVEAIIGKNVGDKLSLDLTVPKDFTDKTVAEKPIHFDITIEAKVITVTPEFTDDFVKTNYGYLGLSTKDQFLAYLEEDIYISQIYNDIWNVIMENLKMESYDTDALKDLTEELKEYEEYQVYVTYGIDLPTYLSYMGITEDEFDDLVEESAKEYMKQEILVTAIAEAENLVITDELYEEKLLEYAKAYGFDTTAEFQSQYSDMTREDFEFTILSELVIKFVSENVVFVDGLGLRNEEETSGETTTGETSTEAATDEATTGEATTGEETSTEEETTK